MDKARILMLVENHYPQDTRVRNEATLLSSSGYHVSVIALREVGQAACEVLNGVVVYRVPRLELFKKTSSKRLGRAGQLFLKLKSSFGYLVEYCYFTAACLAVASYVFVRRGFDAIHAHNPPDTLFLAALPFKLFGRKFVFDHHDLCPELYRSRYGTGEGFYTQVLRVFEWCSLKMADVVIATNESYKKVQIERAGKDPERIFVVRNGPNKSRMASVAPSARLKGMGKCILCYVGSLNPQDGVDYLLRSLWHLVNTLKRADFYCVIMGSGDSLGDLRALASERALDGFVELTGFVSDEELQAKPGRGRHLRRSRPVKSAQRCLHLDQDHGVHELFEADRHLRPQGDAIFRAGCRDLCRTERRSAVRGSDRATDGRAGTPAHDGRVWPAPG